MSRVGLGRGKRPRIGFLLALCLFAPALPHAGAAASQPVVETHDALVLVLNLTSQTHARPTSGVVVTHGGLVLVAADFVRPGDEIVVLQGGTDLQRHAIPTRLVARSAESGVAALLADGLRIPPATLGQDRPEAGEGWALHAFPSAERLAAGEAPGIHDIRLERDPDGNLLRPSDAPAGISGPVFNRCGQLAGLLLAAHGGTTDAERPSRVVFALDIVALLADQTGVEQAWCEQSPPSGEAAAPSRPIALRRSELEVLDPVPATDPGAAEIGERPDIRPFDPTRVPSEPMTGTPEPGASTMPAEPGSSRSQPLASGDGAWAWLFLLPVLLAAIALFRRRMRSGPASTAIRADPTAAFELVLIAWPDSDRESRRLTRIEDGDDPVECGRLDGALRLAHPSLAGRHAGFRVHRGRLYVMLLDESAFISIGGLPCLVGECLEVRADDELTLGEVPCRVSLHSPVGSKQ